MPAVVEYEFDQALPNITTYEPSEKSELPRVAISASSVRVTGSTSLLALNFLLLAVDLYSWNW